MNKLGLMTLTGFAISLMMVMASFAANTGSSLGYSESEGSTGNLGIFSDEGMSPDQEREYGVAPEYRGNDFDTLSEGMSSGQDREQGVYDVTPNKDLNAPY